MRAHHRHVARVVAHAVVLLEADLVRFVDHDQAQPGIGQEQGGARADDDLRLPAGDRAPGAAALGRLERGMPDDRRRTEAILEPAEEGLGQRDLGQEDEDLPIRVERGGNRFEIGFGLARSGHAVEQEGREGRFVHRVHQPRRDRGLFRVEVHRRVTGPGAGIGAVAIDGDRFHRALIDQPAQHAFGNAGDLRQLADRRLFALQPLHRAFALGRHAFGHSAAQPVFGHRRRAAQRAAAGDHHPRDRRQRGAVIVGGPFDQAA